eukprot:10886217-Alexandrium_andersonii.AAC.1
MDCADCRSEAYGLESAMPRPRGLGPPQRPSSSADSEPAGAHAQNAALGSFGDQCPRPVSGGRTAQAPGA